MLLFSIVRLISKATPILCDFIFSKTNWLGVFIGKGPFVSAGETVQFPSVDELEPELSLSFFEQDSSSLEAVARDAIPKIPFRMNFFLSIISCF
ncbi:hypothetical protein D3C85_1192310 [compost metagenome]